MEPVIISGLVTIVACFITGWISYLNTNKTIKNNNEKIKADVFSQSMKTYKELITSERIRWLNELRLSMAECFSKANMIIILSQRNTSLKEDITEKEDITVTSNFFECNAQNLQNFFNACYLIQFRLNPNQENHQEILSNISKLAGSIGYLLGAGTAVKKEKFDLIYKEIGDAADSCQRLLKSEWEHAKKEAKELQAEQTG